MDEQIVTGGTLLTNEVLITGILGIITSIISGWVSYFFTRKKYNSEVDLNLIEKMQGDEGRIQLRAVFDVDIYAKILHKMRTSFVNFGDNCIVA